MAVQINCLCFTFFGSRLEIHHWLKSDFVKTLYNQDVLKKANVIRCWNIEFTDVTIKIYILKWKTT